MPTAATLRAQIESTLADRIPSALTPAPRLVRSLAGVGIPSVDRLLSGGLPLGAITEVVGPECSGRTSFALSFLSRITQAGKVCAWIDVSNNLHPESAVAMGVDLSRLLWVRCGVLSPLIPRLLPATAFALPEQYLIPASAKKGLHGGGFGPHPRKETKGLSKAVSDFLQPEVTGPRCAEPQRRTKPEPAIFVPNSSDSRAFRPIAKGVGSGKPWACIEQALRATDLLLQGGGFSAVVLDFGSIAPEHAARVPLATWFRYRAAAERTQASILLLTQHPCAKSSAELVLGMQPGKPLEDETTVFTGLTHKVTVTRERFAPAPTNVIPLRKPPQGDRSASWNSRTVWAGCR